MKEFYPGNSFYGHGNIIRKYSGFPRWLPLPVCIQHGWMVKVSQHDARADAAENWYWSPEIAEIAKKEHPYIKYRIAGSPFLYCLKNINYQHCDADKRKGTIVFPFHSTESIDLDSELDKYCQLLSDLPDEYKPVIICVYHSDKIKGTDNFFLKNGFDVVCNGDNPCSDVFLYNFIKNTQNKKYLISNEWSTAMHYGAITGCQIHLYGPQVKVLKSNDKNFSKNFRDLYFQFDRENRQDYCMTNTDRKKQCVIADQELGTRHLISKTKMLLLLWRLVFTPQYFKKIPLYS